MVRSERPRKEFYTYYHDLVKHGQNGGNVTHILNVILGGSISREEKKLIKKAIWDIINNVEISLNVKEYCKDFTNVSVKWIGCPGGKGAYYHCDNPFWGDLGVQAHASALQKDLYSKLEKKFVDIFSANEVCMFFLVTKPLQSGEVYRYPSLTLTNESLMINGQSR